MENKLLTTKQLADALQICEVTLWRWRKRGMPFKKIGSKVYRYDLEEVKKWSAEKQ